MRFLPFRFMAGTLVLMVGAHAQTPAAIQRYLADQHKGCSIYGYYEYFRGMAAGIPEPVTIASYTIELCGGGNNFARTVGVFYESNGKVRQFKSPPINGPDLGDPSGVTVRGDQFTVRSLAYGPNDARCCPSIKQTATYRLMNGTVVAVR